MLKLEALIHCGMAPTQAKQFQLALEAGWNASGFTTPLRRAHYMAQAMHESTGFTHLEENLYYTTPERIAKIFKSTVPNLAVAKTLIRNPKALANHVYANRNGNGDSASGDGWNYRGRGPFMLTCKGNYTLAERDTGSPYVSKPDLVVLPFHGVLTSCWFFKVNGCVDLADADDINGITRRINGRAMLGLTERKAFYRLAMEAFND